MNPTQTPQLLGTLLSMGLISINRIGPPLELEAAMDDAFRLHVDIRNQGCREKFPRLICMALAIDSFVFCSFLALFKSGKCFCVHKYCTQNFELDDCSTVVLPHFNG